MNNTSIDIYKYVKRIVCYNVASYTIWHFIKRMNSKGHDFNVGSNASCRFGKVFYDGRIAGIGKK